MAKHAEGKAAPVVQTETNAKDSDGCSVVH